VSAPRQLGLVGAALVAALVAIVVYLNTLGNGFALDDQHIVLENEAIHTLAGIPGALGSPYWPGELGRVLGLWRPLSSVALGLVWVVSDGAPQGFHLLNVALHAGATAVLVLLLGRFLPVGAALLAGLVFAVHPVHVEAVANVVGVAELLSALLFLLACLVWWDGSHWPEEATAWEAGSPPGRRPAFAVPGPGRLPLLVLLYAAAFATKESAVTLPAALVLLDAVRRPIPLRQLASYLAPRAAAFTLLG